MSNSGWTKDRKRKLIIRIGIAVLFLIIAIIAAIEINLFIEKNTYKLLYPQEIIKYSEKYELDPYLVAAVIHVESGNKSEAKSNKGALGLMQIMPDTGKWIAGKLGADQYNSSLLFNPDTNIEFGCWYLNYLFDKFGNNGDTVIAAYNAGPGKVTEWLNDPEHSVDGETIESIPYEETSNYVKKVQRAYEKYLDLYKKELQ